MSLTRYDLLRYALWAQLLATADANRRKYHLPTTWVLHTIGNTVALLLPEIYRGASGLVRLARGAPQDGSALQALLDGVMHDVVLDNPRYGEYVAPAAVAYVLSHPDFNIYKGDLARLRFLGFGLDAIPHASTAYALSNLVLAVLASLERRVPASSALAAPLEWVHAHEILVAGFLLAAATTAYESGEYVIHNLELAQTHGDAGKINMEWDWNDTIHDVLADALGYLVAAVLHRRP